LNFRTGSSASADSSYKLSNVRGAGLLFPSTKPCLLFWGAREEKVVSFPGKLSFQIKFVDVTYKSTGLLNAESEDLRMKVSS
jgi:hypothetical protein